ncbi:putative T7SS-secreted protein [Amycolatopsis sp. NPDC054798]
MAELGETGDPRALVPGSPDAIEENVRVLAARGDAAERAAEGLRSIDTGAWEGPAARAFHDKFSYEPNKWYDASDSLQRAAHLLGDYAGTLRWAQSQAGEAVALWDRGQAATERAKAAHDKAVAQASAADQPPPAFADPGEPDRQAARATLDRARTRLVRAGDSIASMLAAEADEAPRQSDWLDDLGNFARDFGAHAINGLASFGKAMLDHPVETAGFVGGIALTAISAVGEGGGLVLDATGVGAVAGVPLNVVSAAGIATGGAMAVGSASELARHAMTDDKVEVVKPRTNPTTPTKTDRLKEHLTEKDLDGARREAAGEVVKRKSSGVPYDHVDEVRNAQDGLVKRIDRLKRMLGDSRLKPDDRPPLESELSEASKILDYSEQWLPRH